jgi:malonyl-CoA/methylmalonyl-CoA synthetase
VNANLYSHVERAMPADASSALLVTESGRICSWVEMHAQSARYARLLLGLGLQRGARVAVQVEKSPEALYLYLACLRAGLVYLPLNTAYQQVELEYFLRDAEPGAVVCRPGAERALGTLAGSAARIFTLDGEGRGTLTDAAAVESAESPTARVDDDDLAAIIYTSGTTGRSKGAMVTHGNLVSNARTLVDFWGFSRSDVLLHALPTFHVHGLFVANHCALLSGASMRWHARFDAQAVLRDLPHATVLMGVPTFYTRLLADPGFTRERCRGVRLFISGSAPLQLDTFQRFEVHIGQPILERYGMSEAGMITSNPLSGVRKAGSVGQPLPGNQVRVADDRDVPLTKGEVGGIQIRGANVFKGYWRMPEKTREEFTADGWFRTGDVGAFDADGYLSIVGRAKDLIITGGYNVYPKELELLIDAMPGVQESAVFGVPHPDFGEAVTAAVVPLPGASISETEVVQRLKAQIANYKIPKRVAVVAELPRNAMGKVQKNVLRATYAAG